MRNKIILFITLLFISASFLFGVLMYINENEEEKLIKNSIKMAILAIDTDRVERINTKLLNGSDKYEIYNSEDYNKVKDKLIKIAEYFPLEALWAYLILPVEINKLDEIAINQNSMTWKVKPSSIPDTKWSLLSVVTVAYDNADPDNTLPGVIFQYDMHEEIVRSIDGAELFTTSELSYDPQFDIWTKASFHRVFNTKGELVAILGVDLKYSYIMNTIVNSILISILYGSLFSLILGSWIYSRIPKKKNV